MINRKKLIELGFEKMEYVDRYFRYVLPMNNEDRAYMIFDYDNSKIYYCSGREHEEEPYIIDNNIKKKDIRKILYRIHNTFQQV